MYTCPVRKSADKACRKIFLLIKFSNGMKNKQGGFLQIIIFIIVVVLILSYFHVSLSGVVNYIITAFHNVFG